MSALPFPIGQTSTNASNAALLGSRYEQKTTVGIKTFVLVKAAAQLATPTRFAVVSALSGGLPTWNVNYSTTAGAGPALVISTDYTSTIASGAYFLAQIAGPAEIVSAAAIAAFALVGTSTTSGKCDDATITGGSIGYALEAAAGVDENVGVMLRG